MSKRSRILVTAAALVLLGGFIWEFLRPHEPVFRDKYLTSWLEQYSTNRSALQGRAASEEAETAIRRIGTNALPVLLRLLASRDPLLEPTVTACLPQTWVSRIYPRLADEQRRLALHGFAALGPIAKPAVLPLMDLANDRNPDVRHLAIKALSHLGAAAQPAIPLLIQRLDDPDVETRMDAMLSLGAIHLEPELVIPVLIKHAQNREELKAMRLYAINGLGKFGPQANQAVPILLELLNDYEMGGTAIRSLWSIDREAARRAGVRLVGEDFPQGF